MPDEHLNLDVSLRWQDLTGPQRPYQWGDPKSENVDSNWAKPNVIYRWVKNSTQEIAHIGETTKRTLTQRVNNYVSARPGSKAGATNKKLFEEQRKLPTTGESLALQFIDEVPGFNLSVDRERQLAEQLLVGYYRPYLFGA